MAAVNVQNRVSRATGQLPAEVTQVGVTTSKRQTSILQMFSLSSPDDSYDENFLSNYISINLKPQILRISGVGDLMIMGGEYSMRVWMKPDVMAPVQTDSIGHHRCASRAEYRIGYRFIR